MNPQSPEVAYLADPSLAPRQLTAHDLNLVLRETFRFALTSRGGPVPGSDLEVCAPFFNLRCARVCPSLAEAASVALQPFSNNCIREHPD